MTPVAPAEPLAPVEPRERLLETASALFYEHGVRAIGIDRIVAESGVAKATLYRHFKTKHDLVVAFVQLRDERWRAWLRGRVEQSARTGPDRPLAVFDAVYERCAAREFRGCAFSNTIADVADATHPAHLAAAEHKRQVRDYIADLLAAVGVPEPLPLAGQWLLLLDGAVVTSLREGSPAPASLARDAAATLLAVARG